MSWTFTAPTPGNWYWYREPGLNLDRPMPAWIFGTGEHMVYATLCAVHEQGNFQTTRHIQQCPGEWSGPIPVPEMKITA